MALTVYNLFTAEEQPIELGDRRLGGAGLLRVRPVEREILCRHLQLLASLTRSSRE